MESTPLSYDELCQRSARQPYTFPLGSNRIAQLTKAPFFYSAERIAEQAAGVRAIAHPSVVRLAHNFLEAGRENGSAVEQALYQQLDLPAFLHKLLSKRPLMFMGEDDYYLLRDGTTRGYGGFDAIGTEAERSPLLLRDYNSYHEMPLAALLGVSVPTYFLNNGNRHNQGQPAAKGSFEEEGVYTGLVGARFERPGRMEWQHMIVSVEQNSAANGYGPQARPADWTLPLWAQFYGEGAAFPDYETAASDRSGKFVAFDANGHSTQACYLNTHVFKQRMRLIAEPYLRDANQRGKEAGKQAYVIVVGFGLGVWAISELKDLQAQLLVEAFLEALAGNAFPHISDLVFSWFPEACRGATKRMGAIHRAPTSAHPEITFSRANPIEPLIGPHQGKLLVASYAWDGNAYPGNEYWQGSLSASGDPAAACCSTIGELQNPDINLEGLRDLPGL